FFGFYILIFIFVGFFLVLTVIFFFVFLFFGWGWGGFAPTPPLILFLLKTTPILRKNLKKGQKDGCSLMIGYRYWNMPQGLRYSGMHVISIGYSCWHL
ncbi:MAG: hypothetical protein AAGD25_28505, partial [Cyanobacteria bacterium P01_F01_bin.150]